MEHISRMAAEVNKLIGGKLLAGETIYLPEVGSLYIVVNSAEKKKIEFSSNNHGTSLISVIESRAKCTTKQAVDIYNKWREEVSSDQTLTIEGVGVLRGGMFVTKDSYSTQLNPKLAEQKMAQEKKQEEQPKEKKRIVPIFFVFIALLLIGVIGYFIGDYVKKSQEEKAYVAAIAKQKADEQQRINDSVNLAKIETLKAEEAAKKEVVEKPVSGRYKVVYGVFSLRSNVDSAIDAIAKIEGTQKAKEYPLGSKIMVTMFESDDRAECQKFLMTNLESYPDTWIYESKR